MNRNFKKLWCKYFIALSSCWRVISAFRSNTVISFLHNMHVTLLEYRLFLYIQRICGVARYALYKQTTHLCTYLLTYIEAEITVTGCCCCYKMKHVVVCYADSVVSSSVVIIGSQLNDLD